jgi:glucose-6-phosphate isomerase
MWDWIGGRTSELSTVGLLPAALQGINIDGLLEGGRIADAATRTKIVRVNPSAQLALAWFASGNGKGNKRMVVLPYKDRLELFSKYLQQLVMESIGKKLDLDGNLVNQGLCVLGNKGSTDQHSYIQQLRDGINDFFVIFIEVLKDQSGVPIFTAPDATSGDFLEGFFLGTRSALAENDRESLTITVKHVDSKSVGTLIAIFERAVSFYASLINVNAYHQPGVEAGKKSAENVLVVQQKIFSFLKSNLDHPFTVREIAKAIGQENDLEIIFKIIEHIASNSSRKITKISSQNIFEASYKMT